MNRNTEMSWQQKFFGPTPSFLKDACMYLFTAEIAAISILSVPSLLINTKWKGIISLQLAATFSFLVIFSLTIGVLLTLKSNLADENNKLIPYTPLDTIGCSLMAIVIVIMQLSFIILTAGLALNATPDSFSNFYYSGAFDGMLLAFLVFAFIKLSSV